jgi:hypothetical protein
MATSEKANKLLRLPADLLAQLGVWAEEDDRSVNSLIVHVLRQAVRDHQVQQERRARDQAAA